MTDDLSNMTPCPFCGGGETEIRTNYMPVRMSRKPEIISVEVNHWCHGLTKGAQRRSVHAHGRDRDDAIEAWNRRSAAFVPLPEIESLRAENARLRADVPVYSSEIERLRGEMPVAESLRVDAKCAEIERDEARAVVWKQAKENADLRAEVERLTSERDEVRAEAQRLRASNERLHRALFRIAGKAPFADDPWTISMEAMKREAKP